MRRLKRSLLAALWTAAGLLAVLFLVRSFVADVYRVESGSMEPYLFGGDPWGEWVLVEYGEPKELRRFDTVVTYEPGGRPVVKRVVGLSGETVQVREGDLFVNGERLAPTGPRPEPVVLFDSTLHDLADHFELRDDQWSHDPSTGVWTLEEPSFRTVDGNYLRWRSSFDDGYLLPDDTRRAGSRHVGDGVVCCEVRGAGEVRLELRESGDLFRAVVSYESEDERLPFENGAAPMTAVLASVRIERLHDDRETEVLARSSPVVVDGQAGGPWRSMSFANVDNVLVFRMDDLTLVAPYAENRPPAGRAVTPGVTVGTQVALGAETKGVEFRNIRIARDLHWISRGEHAVDRPLSLGPNECFLLGDNSAKSLDGRTYGATELDEILGRPVRVLWPRDRARRLDTGLAPLVPPDAMRAGGDEGNALPAPSVEPEH